MTISTLTYIISVAKMFIWGKFDAALKINVEVRCQNPQKALNAGTWTICQNISYKTCENLNIFWSLCIL